MNPLEDKVKSILEDNNWKTDIGLHYKDPATGLPRDVDAPYGQNAKSP